MSRYWLVVTSSPSPSAESDFPLFFFVPFIPSEENFVRQRAEVFFMNLCMLCYLADVILVFLYQLFCGVNYERSCMSG